MTTQKNIPLLISFSALLLIVTGLAAWLQLPYLLLVPPVVMAMLFLVQHPYLLLYAIMITIPWSIEFNITATLGTDLPDEPLMWLAAVTAIMLCIVHRKKLEREKFLHPLICILLIQFIWTGCTVITSTEKLLSIKYLLAKSWYLLAFVVLPLFFFDRIVHIKRAALLLAFSMLVFMCYAMVRHSQYNWTFEKINDALDPFYRNHVNYSALLAFIVPIQVAAFQLSKNRQVRVILSVVMLITIVALYFSYARGAWLAIIVAVVGYWMIRKKLLFYGYVLFIVLTTVAALWLRSNQNYLRFSHDFKTTVFHTDFREHLAATYQFRDASTAERFYRWVAGVRMVEDGWKTGLGPSSFYRQYKSYTQPAFKTWVSKNVEQSTVHNYFLLQLIEQGVPGLLLFITLLGAMFWYAQRIYLRAKERFWKITTAAVAAILLMECVINFLSDMIETDKAGPVFYLSLVILIMADLRGMKDQQGSDTASDVQRIS